MTRPFLIVKGMASKTNVTSDLESSCTLSSSPASVSQFPSHTRCLTHCTQHPPQPKKPTALSAEETNTDIPHFFMARTYRVDTDPSDSCLIYLHKREKPSFLGLLPLSLPQHLSVSLWVCFKVLHKLGQCFLGAWGSLLLKLLRRQPGTEGSSQRGGFVILIQNAGHEQSSTQWVCVRSWFMEHQKWR